MNDRTRLAIFFIPGTTFLVLGIVLGLVNENSWMWETGVSTTFLGGILLLWGFSVLRDFRLIEEKRKGV